MEAEGRILEENIHDALRGVAFPERREASGRTFEYRPFGALERPFAPKKH